MWGKRQGCYGMSRPISCDYCLEVFAAYHDQPSHQTMLLHEFDRTVLRLSVSSSNIFDGFCDSYDGPVLDSCSNAHEYTALSLGTACPAKPFCQPHILLIRRQFTNSHVAWRPS